MLTFEGNCVSLFGHLLEVTHHNAKQYVSLYSLCEVFGLDGWPQIQRVTRDPVYDIERWPGHRGSKSDRCEFGECQCEKMGGVIHLEVGGIPFWIMTIQDERLSPEAKGKVEQFQEECAKALMSSPRIAQATEDLLRDLFS
jgi:hypothetical protein